MKSAAASFAAAHLKYDMLMGATGRQMTAEPPGGRLLAREGMHRVLPQSIKPQAATMQTLPTAQLAPLEALKSVAQIQHLRRRQRILASPNSALIVHSGVIAMETMLQPSVPGPLDIAYPGDILFLPHAEQASGFAAAPAEVWRLKCCDLANAQSRDPALAEFVIRQLSAQRQRAQLRRAVISELPIDERLAALLIEFASRVGVTSNQGVTFDMPLSRAEIASLLGLNADTLSRIMSRFTSEGLIARSSRTHVTVRGIDKLRSMCRFSNAVIEQATA